MGDRPRPQERPSIFFWLVVGAATFYLGVRLVQGVAWLVERVL